MTNRLISIMGLCLLGALIALPSIAQDTPPDPVATEDVSDGVEINVEVATEEANDGSAPAAPTAPGEAVELPTGESAIINPADAAAESTAEATPSVASTAPQVVAISDCPTLVQEGFTATNQVCSALNPGEACVGNGSVSTVSSVPIDGFSFATGGDRTQFVNINEMQLRTTGTANTVWTIVRSRILLNTTSDGDAVNADMVVFGDVQISDQGELTDSNAARPANVIADFGLNVRREPNTTGAVVYQLSPGEEIIATGITADRQWLRIQIPTQFAGTGWVYATYMDVEGGAEALPFVRQGDPPPNLTAPDFGPMQAFDFQSATTPDTCETTGLDSGILMQSPGGSPGAVRVRINDIEIQLAGTAFIQAQPNASLQVSVLEGQATVIASGTAQTARAGDRATVPLSENLNPTGVPSLGTFNTASLVQLPTDLLQRPVNIARSGGGTTTASQPQAQTQTQPQTQAEQPQFDQIDEVLNDSQTAQQEAAPAAPVGSCVIAITANIIARRGPDDAFGVLTRLLAGDQPEADGLTITSNGDTWFRLVQGGWLNASAPEVDESGECLSLPQVEAPEPPESSDTGTNNSQPVVQATSVPQTASTSQTGTVTDTTNASADTATNITTTVNTTSGLASSTLGEICTNGIVTDSGTPSSEGAQTVVLGGTWSATAGTTVRIDSQGGQIFGETSDFISLITTGGELLAGSGGNRTLIYTFSQDQTFITNFAAVDNVVVVMGARCTSTN